MADRAPLGTPARSFDGFRMIGFNGESDSERRPFSGFAFYLDIAAMTVDDAVADRQS